MLVPPPIYPYVPAVTKVFALLPDKIILFEPDITIEPVRLSANWPAPAIPVVEPNIKFDCEIAADAEI